MLSRLSIRIPLDLRLDLLAPITLSQRFQMSNFAFLVGIDWADKKHDIAVVNDQGKMESLKVIEHSIRSCGSLAF